MGLLSFYFLPQGRISRVRFWLGFIGLLLIAAAFDAWIAGSLFNFDFFHPQALSKPAVELISVVDVIFLFPIFVVLAQRYHDRDKGAAWTLPFLIAYLALLGAFAGGLLPTQFPVDVKAVTPVAWSIMGLCALVFVITLLELGSAAGTSGDNRYGRDRAVD